MSKEMSKKMSKSMEEALRISRQDEDNQGPISVAPSYPGTIVTERMTAYGEEDVKNDCPNGICTISGGRRRRQRKSRKTRRHRKTRRNHRSRRFRRR